MNWVFYKQQYANYLHTERSQGGWWWLWFFMLPLVPILVYTLLGYLKVLPSEDGLPGHIYIILGITSWLLYSDAIVQPSLSMTRFKPYFLRQEISLWELLTAWLPERLGTAVIQFTFSLTLVWAGNGFETFGLALYFLVMILGVFLFISLGMLFAILSLISPNSLNLVQTINRFMIFLSAVIFPMPDGVFVKYIKVLNPYYVYIDSSRSILFDNTINWQPILIWSAIALLLIIFLKRSLQKITPEVRGFLQ